MYPGEREEAGVSRTVAQRGISAEGGLFCVSFCSLLDGGVAFKQRVGDSVRTLRGNLREDFMEMWIGLAGRMDAGALRLFGGHP